MLFLFGVSLRDYNEDTNSFPLVFGCLTTDFGHSPLLRWGTIFQQIAFHLSILPFFLTVQTKGPFPRLTSSK